MLDMKCLFELCNLNKYFNVMHENKAHALISTLLHLHGLFAVYVFNEGFTLIACMP